MTDCVLAEVMTAIAAKSNASASPVALIVLHARHVRECCKEILYRATAMLMCGALVAKCGASMQLSFLPAIGSLHPDHHAALDAVGGLCDVRSASPFPA